MTRRAWLGLLSGLLLVIGAFLLVGRSSPYRDRSIGHSAARAALAARPAGQLLAGSHAGLSRSVPPIEESSDPERAVHAFLVGWLACMYHQGPCASIAAALDAYGQALGRQHAPSRPTPAEHLAHPRLTSVQIIRDCRRSATATATYQDGNGGRFQLHLSLVNQRGGWKAFDVAEASPHIPLPAALNRGPGRC